MRRFTLVTGMGEAELQADPEGDWVPVEDHKALIDRLEKATKVWRDEDEVNGGVSGFLLRLVDNARRA